MSNRKTDCHARQYNDQMVCGKCGLAWDINDPEPPECSKPKPNNGDHWLARIRHQLKEGRK